MSPGSIPLRIETHPRDQLAENGDIVTFFCNATGDPPIMYQWFHNNDTISLFVSNATILEVTALYDDFGSYHCNATSGNEEVASNSATLTGMKIYYCYIYYTLNLTCKISTSTLMIVCIKYKIITYVYRMFSACQNYIYLDN